MTATARPKWMLWTGRVLSFLPCLVLLFSAFMKLAQKPEIVEVWTQKFGFPRATLPLIGAVEASCVVVYAFPRTAVLGAILITGYMGGAMVTHIRIGEPFILPLLLGVFVWAGIYLRDRRLSELLPLRKPEP